MGTRSRKMKRTKRGGCWKGGALGSAPLNDASMLGPGSQNLAQGGQYLKEHIAQHGGAAVSLAAAAPVGATGMLDSSLRDIARVGVLDQSMQAIQGMSDQAGGSRSRRGHKQRGHKQRRHTRRGHTHRAITHKNIMKALKKLMKKRTFRHRGGAYSLSQAGDYSSPGMLLSPAAEARALGGMNPEWKLAANPTSFTPK